MLKDIPPRLAAIVFFLIAMCNFWTTAFLLDIEPWETDRPAPGDILFYNVIIEPGDPKIVDVILYNGDLGNFTIVFDHDTLKGNSDATGFNIPFVPPGAQFRGRLGRPSTAGREILAESSPFEIFPIGTKSSTDSASHSSGSSAGSKPTSIDSISISVATMTKILTLQPSARATTSQTSSGNAFVVVPTMGTLIVGVVAAVFCFQ